MTGTGLVSEATAKALEDFHVMVRCETQDELFGVFGAGDYNWLWKLLIGSAKGVVVGAQILPFGAELRSKSNSLCSLRVRTMGLEL